MNALQKGWTIVRLSDVLISLESGSRPKGGVKGIKDGLPSIGGEHLTYEGKFDFSSLRYVPEKFASRMQRGYIFPNDILIVKDSATTGKTALVDNGFLAEQHEIVRRVEGLFWLADRIEDRYQKAKACVEQITQAILAKAFRGELVPQDPMMNQLPCYWNEFVRNGNLPSQGRRKGAVYERRFDQKIF